MINSIEINKKYFIYTYRKVNKEKRRILMRRKSFTLLELVIVLIILGVLATLGISQYMRSIEQSRGAEARSILGQIRTSVLGYYMSISTLTGIDNTAVGIGTTNDLIPSSCRASHYFNYALSLITSTTLRIDGTRCSAGGKTPTASVGIGGIQLTVDANAGTDTWSMSPAYR
jgi:prepilin-type N-terminal cleavage/methylation domain-containing protein